MSTSTYYAVCHVNGPISVRLSGNTLEYARVDFFEGDPRSWIDEPRTDAEDDLDIDGADMSATKFDEALRAARRTPGLGGLRSRPATGC